MNSAKRSVHDDPGNVESREVEVGHFDRFQARRDGLEMDDTVVSKHKMKFEAALRSKTAIVLRDFGLIALLLGWWIPAVINTSKTVRHRIIPSTIIVWFFILLILFHKSKYLPQRPFAIVLAKIWNTLLGKPWSMLSHPVKLIVG
jgi:CNT family concentrative nucleoside transporter